MKVHDRAYSLKMFWPQVESRPQAVNAVLHEHGDNFPALNRDNLSKAYSGTLIRASAATALDLLGLARAWSGRDVDLEEIIVKREV